MSLGKFTFILVFFSLLAGCRDASEVRPIFTKSLPEISIPLFQLQDSIAKWESRKHLRTDNESRIIFQDSTPTRTEYVVVYLHGFAGSYRDGYPVNKMIADTLKANLLYARWGDHGQYPPYSMEHFTPENAWADAQKALSLGQLLGEKIILMSTSTGGTLSTLLAAEYPENIYAMVNISPNYQDDQTGASLLNSLFGEELAYIAAGGQNRKLEFEEPQASQYWDTLYPAVALTHLQNLVETAMTKETFTKVTSPLILLYYKENILQEDSHVEVDIFPKVFKQFSTPDSLKVLKKMDKPKTHFMGSSIKTEEYKLTFDVICSYLQNTLHIDL